MKIVLQGIIQIISFTLIGFSIIKLLLNTARNFYLWQIKEYRLDRVKSYFKIKTNRIKFQDQFNIFKFKNRGIPKLTARIIISFFILFLIAFRLFFPLLDIFFYINGSILSFININLSFFWAVLVILLFYNWTSFILVSFVVLLMNILLYPVKKVLVWLARKKLEKNKDLIVIGITGSYGKSSVKEILSHLLMAKYNVCKTPENWNTELGIGKTILKRMKLKDDIFVCEIGAYKKGEISSICSWLKPDIGILTGISNQHLALFGSEKNIILAKKELLDSLPPDGSAFINKTSRKAKEAGAEMKDVETIYYGTKQSNYQTNLIGEFQQVNIQGAVEVAQKLKLSKSKIRQRLKNIPQTSQLMQIKEGKNGTKIIDDSYNLSFKGFIEALKVIDSIDGEKKIVITPGIIELGQESTKIHQRINRKLTETADKVFLSKMDFSDQLDGEVKEDPKELYQAVKQYIKKDNIILLAGRVPDFLKNKLFAEQ